MRFAVLAALLGLSSRVVDASTSGKRGLAYTYAVPAGGNDIWDSDKSDLKWYYNYGAQPIDDFDHKLQFVPMLWGVGDAYSGFYDQVKKLLDEGRNIKRVLGFNEPDLCGSPSNGGSCISAKKAAEVYIKEITPLKKHGVNVGAPAVTNGGLDWLKEFHEECNLECKIDFLPLHYYGDYDGFVDYIQLVRKTYPHLKLWVTEFGFPNASVSESKKFVKDALKYLDSLEYVAFYSYFGAFRSDDANSFLGGNGAMLNKAGQLTDIGAWYLGEHSTGILPYSSKTRRRRSVKARR